MEVSDQLHAPAALPPEKEPGGPQSRSGRGGEEKNSQHLPELEPPPPDHSAAGMTRKYETRFGKGQTILILLRT